MDKVNSKPDEQALFGKHLRFCMSSRMFVSLFDKHFFAYDKQKMFLALTSKICLLSNACHGGQTHKQNLKFLPCNACTFGPGIYIKTSNCPIARPF